MHYIKAFLYELARQYKFFHFLLTPLFCWIQKFRRKRNTKLKKMNENFLNHAGDLLGVFKNCLDKNGLQFWLTAGTLLGAYREKRLLTHDLDLDVAMFEKDMAKVKEVLLAEGFTLEHEYGIVDEGVTEMAFSYKEVKIDIFFTKKINNKFANYIFYKDIPSEREDDYRVVEMFLPETDFIEYDFLGAKYLIPAKTVEYLSANYGPSFMTPNKYWNFTRDIPSAVYHKLKSKRGFHIGYGNPEDK